LPECCGSEFLEGCARDYGEFVRRLEGKKWIHRFQSACTSKQIWEIEVSKKVYFLQINSLSSSHCNHCTT
jgi:hypothetical protein